jgi:hypothetical protein
MPCPPHLSWFDLPNDNWRWEQIKKLLIVQLPPYIYIYTNTQSM